MEKLSGGGKKQGNNQYSMRMKNRFRCVFMPIDWWRLPKALCGEGSRGFFHVPMSIMSPTEEMAPTRPFAKPRATEPQTHGFKSTE